METIKISLFIMKYLFLFFTAILFLTGCNTTRQSNTQFEPDGWFNVAIAEDVEIYIDTLSIKHENGFSYAREKRVFITPESKKLYVDKIRNEYTKMGKTEKADKWNDFSYCIYHCEYECANKRFRILSVEDFDSTGKRIIKTTPSKKNIKWLNVETETVGDYTFFFVCDYQ